MIHVLCVNKQYVSLFSLISLSVDIIVFILHFNVYNNPIKYDVTKVTSYVRGYKNIYFRGL